MANQINLQFMLGEHWVIDFELNDETNADIDLTGATVEFTMFDMNENEIFTLSTADDPSAITIDSPPIGTGSIVITPIMQLQNANLTPDVFNYEIQATLADQRVTTQIFGRITALASLFSWGGNSGATT